MLLCSECVCVFVCASVSTKRTTNFSWEDKTVDCRAFSEANSEGTEPDRQIRTKLTSPSDKETDRVSELMERRVTARNAQTERAYSVIHKKTFVFR